MHKNTVTEVNKQNSTPFRELKMKEIHKPSALEGALWTALGIKDAIVIFHAPPGCFINQFQGLLMHEYVFDFYTTSLNYANIMQGTETRLEEVLTKIWRKRPKLIIIVTSPVAEITGDDIKGVVDRLGYQNCLIFYPPIGGSFHEGREHSLINLIELMKPGIEKVDKSVNLIGPFLGTYNWRADLFELKRMLSEIGIRINAVLTGNSQTEEIIHAPRASLNLCVYPYDCGIEAAKIMEEKFNIPYLAKHVPIGFRESAAWIEEIANFFNIDARDYLKKEITSAYELIQSFMVLPITFESSVALSLDNNDTYAVGISNFFKKELGMEIVMAAVGTEAAAKIVKKVCENVLITPTIDEKRKEYEDKSPSIIIGNFYDIKIARELGFINYLFADIPTMGHQTTEANPYMGFMGAKNLIQQTVNQLYVNIFLETKGGMEEAISPGVVDWDLEARKAFVKVAEMIPHFIRAIAVRKLQKRAEEIAIQQGTKITTEIVKQVTEQYTPTRYKSKFLPAFKNKNNEVGGTGEKSEFTMLWDASARSLIEKIPKEIQSVVISGTEEFARKKGFRMVTPEIIDLFRKESGMV